MCQKSVNYWIVELELELKSFKVNPELCVLR